MRLTRRDALAALSAIGAGGVAGCSAPSGESLDDETTIDSPVLGDDDLETLIALAGVLYPNSVENVAEFVDSYVRPRLRQRPEYGRNMLDAVTALEEYTQSLHNTQYADLDAGKREDLLGYMSVDTADPDPDGVAAERVRYYLVNDLLFGLYSSPAGASLAGLENPPGYPGGTASYQTGPQ